MTCQTPITTRHQTHVAPMNAAGHWRSYTDAVSPCGLPADVHVVVVYPEGQRIERDMCRHCAEEWQANVANMERRGDITDMGIIRPKSTWTITAIEEKRV